MDVILKLLVFTAKVSRLVKDIYENYILMKFQRT